ncbi:heterokaryon incompatibility protein-domain-containing protein [Cladorrhinum sp. PSN259]|nr:heterokaryon incompatibility protein-domain-containing protein [Cladorrhinum sp. PSN259]
MDNLCTRWLGLTPNNPLHIAKCSNDQDCAGCVVLVKVRNHFGQTKPEKVGISYHSLGGARYFGIHVRKSIIDYMNPTAFLYTSEGSAPNPWKLNAPPPSERSVSAAIAQIRFWLGECANHPGCALSSWNPDIPLPTRVLDLARYNPDDLGSSIVTLVESKGREAKYVALSYCWGTQNNNLKTTPETIQRHKQGIPFTDLPLTFQHTAQIARAVDVQYIWIDSLCIIQDEEHKTDWNREAPRMADVYRGSFLTVSATWGDTPHSGCFIDPQPGTTIGPIVVREVKHFPDTLRVALPENNPAEGFHLLTRGWTYQERTLSPRLIHFGRHEMIWECSTSCTCECGQAKDSHLGLSKAQFHDLISSPWGEKWPNAWRRMIIQYSALHLTYASDKLPALSGLADQIQRSSNQTYIAGMWQETLVLDMCWYLPRIAGKPPKRPYATYQAPSWSWASVNGPVEYPGEVYADQDQNGALANPRQYAEVVSAMCFPAGPSPLGSLKGGYVVLSCYLLPAYAVFAPNSWDGISIQVCDWFFDWYPDDKYQLEEGEECYAIPIASTNSLNLYALVVKDVAEDSEDDITAPIRIGLAVKYYQAEDEIVGWEDIVEGVEKDIVELF